FDFLEKRAALSDAEPKAEAAATPAPLAEEPLLDDSKEADFAEKSKGKHGKLQDEGLERNVDRLEEDGRFWGLNANFRQVVRDGEPAQRYITKIHQLGLYDSPIPWVSVFPQVPAPPRKEKEKPSTWPADVRELLAKTMVREAKLAAL